MNVEQFRKFIYSHYQEDGRGMPWRKDTRPYYILVSELMLQQTQVSRVIPKFNDFIERFPDFESLASASFVDVLKLWDGLGYSRRARFLHNAAKQVVNEHGGSLPRSRQQLESLPGVGPGTSGAIMAYAFNKPEPYIETNIRSIYIHCFYKGEDDVDDKIILKKVEETLDTENPRKWYWALMDYGSHLKKTTKNPSRKSKHYKKQSKFEGSNRQLRAKILKLLLVKSMSVGELENDLNDSRVSKLTEELITENLVIFIGEKLNIAE